MIRVVHQKALSFEQLRKSTVQKQGAWFVLLGEEIYDRFLTESQAEACAKALQLYFS